MEVRRSRFLGILAFLVLVLSLFGAAGILRVGPPPEIKITPAIPAIGKRTPVTVDVAEPKRGLRRIRMELVQDEKTHLLAERSYVPRSALQFWGPFTASDTIKADVGRDTVPGLRTGNAVIRVTADRAPTWLRRPEPAVGELALPVRLTPPSLQITSAQTYIAQGGCEAVVYRVGEASVRDGVRSGDWWFPGYPLPGGAKQDRFALFAVPYDVANPNVRLVAIDGAGNEAEIACIDRFFPKPFKADTIDDTDAFMAKVVPEILSQSPEIQDRGNMLDNYLAINGELRRKNAEVLKDLAAKSRPEFLWSGSFSMMPNGKVMSAFADRRTYRYQGRVVDHQDHLGFDLAVIKHAAVPASNGGVVVLARYFGIYGNSVVIDHGFGLMTLYGHLASINVKEGQKVGAGGILGTTGETGLAGGDHLHFTTILQGLPVNPIEWWDAHWIQDRIARKLSAAIRFSQ